LSTGFIPSNGVYYARIKVRGKEIWRSLETTDRDLAGGRLSVFKQEQAGSTTQKNLTLAPVCDRYLRTLQHLKPKTVERIRRNGLCSVSLIKSSMPILRIARVRSFRAWDAKGAMR